MVNSKASAASAAAGTALESMASLRPAELVDLLERIDPTDQQLATTDINELGAAIDPGKLNPGLFVRLLAAIDRLAAGGADLDLTKMGANDFARLISSASADQLVALMAHPRLRARILDEIFRRMSEHFRADRAANTRAVVHWRLYEGAGSGGYDRYETVIENGTCTVNPERTRDARVTITMHPADFLRLITGSSSVPTLFMTGKLRVRGDLAFATGLTGLFDLPRAGRR
ncbi:MAG TPA: SCP2 sterol-binding domain-containing protein [Pseudonocardiaceae bacterium]|jgi:putative sterol carrier protein|nr:SCP2 sterol-binding domain-containing protein [Pseudonocardiaceae bacterium]